MKRIFSLFLCLLMLAIPFASAAGDAALSFDVPSTVKIKTSYVGEAIPTVSLAGYASGGTKPYSFSKVSGPTWLKVSSAGVISGTPTQVCESADSLVVQVTDNKAVYQRATISVGITVLKNKTEVSVIKASSNFSSSQVNSGKMYTPTFTVTQGDPVYFNTIMSCWEKKEGNVWVSFYENDTFYPGTWRYTAQIRIDESNGGCTHVISQSPSVTVNGTAWTIIKKTTAGSDYCYTYASSPEFEIRDEAPISSVAVTVTAPVAGAKPDYSPVLKGSGYYSASHTSGIYKNDVCWYDNTDKKFLTPDSDTFKAGHQYEVRINLTAKNEYTFTDSTTGTINGNASEYYFYPIGMVGSDRPMGGFEYTFPTLPKKTFTVTLNPNGGSVSPTTKTVTYGEAYGTMPTPTRKGYTFAGWWTAKTGGKKVTASTICYASGNYTLYARWTEGYTMTFNPNGGTVSPTTKVVKYGQQYGSLPTPTRAGYTFAGWWTAKTGGKQVTASTVCYASAGYTLYARWTAKKFVVTLNPNGGECATATKTVTYGQAYGTMPVPSPRTGYTFSGWYTAKTGGKKVTATTICYATGNYTLYARWTAKTFTVTLNPNGGSCSTASKKVTYGQTYGTLPTPTRAGYTFAGWWTTKDSGGKQVTATTTCYATGSYTLYARWK